MTTQFEKREVTRSASADEKADLTNRLLEVLSNIDQTREEAKAAAADYRSIITDLHKREIGLRFNLETSTVTQEIDVHPVSDEATGMMQYFDRDGNEVIELRHDLSQKQKEEAAQRRQIGLFGEPQELADLLQAGMQSTFGNDVTVSVNGFQANDIAEFEKRMGDTTNTSPAGSVPMASVDNNEQQSNRSAEVVETDFAPEQSEATAAIADPRQSETTTSTTQLDSTTTTINDNDTFNSADLDQLQAEADKSGTLPPKPEKKGKKKAEPTPATEALKVGS
jgi:hypothetical protein